MTFTIARMVRELAARRADVPALVLGDDTRTFAELGDRGARLASVLAAQGVGAGDRVGFLGRNCPEFFELLTACSTLGAVLAGLNWRLSPLELAAVVADADPALLIAGPDLAEAAATVARQQPAAPRVVGLDELEESLVGAVPWCGPDRDADVVMLLYSSGTTGRPRGTLVTNANLEFTQRSGRLLYGMDEDSVNLVPSPLFHIGGAGYGLTALSQGGTTVLLTEVTPAAVLEAIDRHRVTHTFLVPAVVQMVVTAPQVREAELSSLRLVAYGAAPMSEALLRQAIDALDCQFVGVYGMTETSGTVVALSPEDHDPGGPRTHLLRSIGRGLPWVGEIDVRRLIDLQPTEPGEVGEIWVRSGQVTPGYWRDEKSTRTALTDDGWLRTGDAAYRDEAGFLFLHDRIKDMIISGGENVYPAEVENALAFHPAVSEVAVIGVPSARWGETVKALVVPVPGAEVSERELIQFARGRIAHYKCPTSVEFRTSLPRNASGKLLKKDLRAPYWETV